MAILTALLLSACSGPSGGTVDTTGNDSKSEPSTPPAHHRGGKDYTFEIPLSALLPRSDAILTRLEGEVPPGAVGRVHTLAEDEDLHFALSNAETETPVVCELMNALSIPPGSDTGYWSDRLQQLTSESPRLRVEGVFRLWPDHAAPRPAGDSDAVTSNPSHILEIHPISGFGSAGHDYNTVANIAPITESGEQYPYKDPGRWGDMLSHDVEAIIETKGGRDYLRLTTPQIGFNYWELRVKITGPVTAAPGGHRFTARVETPTRVYTEETRCFTVAGTAADRQAQSLSIGGEPTITAIGRFDLTKLLARGGYSGPPPVELCVFGIDPPHLPFAGGRHRRSRPDEDQGEEIEGDRSPDSATSSGGAGGGRSADGEPAFRSGQSDGDAAGIRYSGGAAPGGGGSAYTGGAELIGNRRTHVYHRAGASNLPALRNRIYFQSEEEAAAAGYRPSSR